MGRNPGRRREEKGIKKIGEERKGARWQGGGRRRGESKEEGDERT